MSLPLEIPPGAPPRSQRAWWKRCIGAALINGVIWIMPPPIHFISLVLPFFSGYSILNDHPVKGGRGTAQIGLVMGATLGGVACLVGVASLAILILFYPDINKLYYFLALGVGVAIGFYTGCAACIGALLRTRSLRRLA